MKFEGLEPKMIEPLVYSPYNRILGNKKTQERKQPND